MRPVLLVVSESKYKYLYRVDTGTNPTNLFNLLSVVAVVNIILLLEC